MMAQGAVAPALANGSTLTKEELREILEYERIVQFKDAILAGTHPRVKIAAHLAGKQITSGRNVSSPISSASRANANAEAAHSTPGSNRGASPTLHNKSPNSQRSTAGTHMAVTRKPEINPVLLEKSEDLIKAEIKLHRERLERDLGKQIEQQRIAAKALLQTSESLPDFDLSEVLSKALAIVHPDTTAEADPSVGARSSTSDSFDENTFYSSQHDTPEPSSPSQGQKEPAEMQTHRALSNDQHPTESSAPIQVRDQEVATSGTSLSQDNLRMQGQIHSQDSPAVPYQKAIPGLQRENPEWSNSDSSPSRKTLTGTMSANESSKNALKSAATNTSVPVVRAHNLSPLAPQPARVSPLATLRDPPVLREPIAIDEGQPAQVAALRNQPAGISSTSNSPKGGRGQEKKKDKKKKKRKTKEAADSPDSPYIKPEPRSPSPYAVAPLPRPQKRQRQSGQYDAELNYDEPRQAPERSNPPRRPEYYEEVREIQPPRAYERVERYDDRYDAELRRPEPIYRRVEREDGDYRQVSGQYARHPDSPVIIAPPYPPSEVRQVRTASRAVIDRNGDEGHYYREREPIPRGSVRPDNDRERSRSPRRSPIAMGPPRQPVRIIIDEYGRKYYDPASTPSVRQSVAPPTRVREPEVIYERAPARTISRAPVETFEEGGVIYRAASPAISVPRRVIMQPEFAAGPDYRSYRQREYSVRPTAGPPGDGYIEVRGPERRQMTHFEEVPREYVQRAQSVRPEPIRYEVPREYAGRLQSVRPEGPPREYASSVRPEQRREMMAQPAREYSVRPEVISHREHVPVAESGYYEQAPARRPAEVAFIERPRARESSVVVYADDVRREVYR